jgi:hypothetical protein
MACYLFFVPWDGFTRLSPEQVPLEFLSGIWIGGGEVVGFFAACKMVDLEMGVERNRKHLATEAATLAEGGERGFA